MRTITLAAMLVPLAIAVMPATASAKYKCSCYTEAKAEVEATQDVKLECAETYKTFNESVSVQESHLKVYVDSSNVVQGDKDANIRFRPRDEKCLERVADGHAKKILWEGAYCNGSSYLDVGQFKIDTRKGELMAIYEARTGGKDYTGLLLYKQQADTKRYMLAACIENK